MGIRLTFHFAASTLNCYFNNVKLKPEVKQAGTFSNCHRFDQGALKRKHGHLGCFSESSMQVLGSWGCWSVVALGTTSMKCMLSSLISRSSSICFELEALVVGSQPPKCAILWNIVKFGIFRVFFPHGECQLSAQSTWSKSTHFAYVIRNSFRIHLHGSSKL